MLVINISAPRVHVADMAIVCGRYGLSPTIAPSTEVKVKPRWYKFFEINPMMMMMIGPGIYCYKAVAEEIKLQIHRIAAKFMYNCNLPKVSW